jgi:hypothetical protein
MIEESRRLISGFDWLICGILSILGHFFCVQSIPWQRSVPVESAPLPIEWVTLAESSESTALVSALDQIPLESPGSTAPDLSAGLNSTGLTIPPLPPRNFPVPVAPAPAPDPIASPLSPAPAPANPLPAASSVTPPEPQGLQVPLGDPLIPLPSPSPPQDSADPWDSLEPLPSVPVLNQVPSGNDRSGESVQEEIRVAANPNPLQFRVTIEVVPSPENPGYTPPRPHTTEQIFTADPLTRSCTVPTLEAVQASGTPLRFQVAIDATGQLTQALPVGAGKTGLYADYQTWAVCLLQDWPFDPAQVQQVPVASNLAVSINIQVLSLP